MVTPGAQGAGGGLVHRERDVHRALHQRDLGRGFHLAAGGGDGAGVGEAEAVAGLAQAIDGEERRRRVDRHRAAVVALAAHRLDHQRGRVLVFLPAADVVAEAEYSRVFGSSKAGLR